MIGKNQTDRALILPNMPKEPNMKETKISLLSLTALLLLSCILLLPIGSNANADDTSFYVASLTDAEVFIDLPALRQYGDYTCGATCVQMLMNWLDPYAADLNLTQYENLLGTTPENGTPPSAIMAYLEENDVAFTASQQLSLDDLLQKLAAGHPVLMPLQAWSSAEDGSYNLDAPSDSESYLVEGHWVICVGYCQNAETPYFIFNDPACVGHTILYTDELNRRWIDMDGAGAIFDHFGIEITQSTTYNKNGLFYMD